MKKLKLEELGRPDVSEYRKMQKIPVVAIIDNVRSAMNVGSIFRSADAFTLSGIFICGISARPPHREIQKTAIGATESVNWQYFDSISNCLDSIKDEYQIIGIEQTDESIKLDEFKIDSNKKYALVLGNEVHGISNEALPYLNEAIEIPQGGTKHSLNVSVAAGVVFWEFYKALNG